MAENLYSKLYKAFDADPEPIVHFIQWLAQSYDLPEKPHVLDIGCGPGRMLCEYERLGWSAVGLEPDPEFYAEAAKLAKQENSASVHVRLGSFNELEEVDSFHLITAINGPFAYLLDRDHQVEALERAYQALQPEGVLFLDMPNLLWFLQNDEEAPSYKKMIDGQEVWLSERYEYDLHEATFTLINEYMVKDPESGPVKFYRTDKHMIISFAELNHLLKKAGFREIRTYQSFEARACERLIGKRMMVSAQKPAIEDHTELWR